MSEKTKKPANPAVVQTVKTIAVLVVICLVCVALLALCNDLLYVSEEEQFNRAMDKIYKDYGGGDEEFNSTFTVGEGAENEFGKISEVYKAKGDAYVIVAEGGGGYKGSVSVYVVVGKTDGSDNVVVIAWLVKDSGGETLMSNITDKQRNSWYVGKSITDYAGADFDVSNNKVAGTTLTSTAINNAVKAACVYGINVLKLVSTPESEARDAVVALLGKDYEGYEFKSVSDGTQFDEYKVGDSTLSFYFEGTKDGADPIAAYVYGQDENRQIVVVKNGLTHAELLAADVVAKSDNATDEIVNKVKSLSYFEYTVHTYGAPEFTFDGKAEIDPAVGTGDKGTVDAVYTSADGTLVITATGNGGYSGGTVTINVVISNGTIAGWYIVSNDKQSFLPNIEAVWDTQAKDWYVHSPIDKDIALGNNKVAGTSMSSTAINNAVNMACAYARSLAQ